MEYKITVFKSMTSDIPFYYDVSEVLLSIKRGKNKDLISKIRSESDKEKRDRLKKNLFYICFSGEFRKRLNEELVEHSGLICLDFDNFPNKKTLDTWLNKIKSDIHCFAAFISPSGMGIKVLFKIPKCKTNDEHNLRFDAIHKYFSNCEYFDKNGKGMNRVCYESYDPNVYVNKDSKIFTDICTNTVDKNDRLSSIKATVDSDAYTVFNKLITWFENKYNLKKGSRNENLFYLASACRDYSIDENIATVLIYNYASNKADDFPSISSEIPIIIKSAYNKVSAGKKMIVIPTESIASDEDKEIDLSSFNVDFDEVVIENIIEDTKIEDVKDESDENKIPAFCEFWKWSGTSNKIDFLKLKKFLQDNGFYRYELNEKNFIFIRVIDNSIQEVDVRHIKDFMLRCLESWDKTDIYNMIAENTKLKKEYLNYLDPLKIIWNKDTKDICWLYFNNTAVKITSENIELVPYIELDGYIWKNQRIKRNFKPLSESKSNQNDFAKFVSNVCASSEKRINSFRSAIGYLMNRHKSKSTAKAVIFNDEIIADEAMGGTGKGLTMQIIGTVRNVVLIPGADFDTGKDFAWQRIGFDTDIVLIDDIEKNFKYKKLFTFITDGWPIRKLYQDEIFLPPEDSPKVVITTNYSLKGDTDSYERRKFELELHAHYSKKYQPIDDFGKEFITEWNAEEKNLCDNYLAYCAKYFLKEGLVSPSYINLEYKKLIVNTSIDFASFAETYLKDNLRYVKKNIYAFYKNENGLGPYDFPNQKIFTDWMVYWGKYKNMNTISRSGAGGSVFVYGQGLKEWKNPKNEIDF